MTFSIDNLQGVATTPLQKICLDKPLWRTRVNVTITFFLVYSIYLSVFHQLMLYSSILVAILIKKHPHITYCAPCHEVNGHDVYLAMNRKSGYDISVSKEAIFKQ